MFALLKRLDPLWRGLQSKVTSCKDYSRRTFKIWTITKGFARIVAQDVIVVLVPLLLSAFNFHTLSQGSL